MLSTTGLSEGVFTSLKVLRAGVLEDVLSIAGAPPDSVDINAVVGLQAALNSKATTTALNNAVSSIGDEIDALDVAKQDALDASSAPTVGSLTVAPAAGAAVVSLTSVDDATEVQLGSWSVIADDPGDPSFSIWRDYLGDVVRLVSIDKVTGLLTCDSLSAGNVHTKTEVNTGFYPGSL